jgi:hypothetical protein
MIDLAFYETDIDLFLFGLNPDEATAKLIYILKFLSKRIPFHQKDILVCLFVSLSLPPPSPLLSFFIL